MVAFRRSHKLQEKDLYDITSTPSVTTTPQTVDETITEQLKRDRDENLESLLLKASTNMTVSFYDTDDIKIENKERQDVTDTDAIRRAIHTISNYYNTLGVWRDDFNKVDNDKLARNAYYAMCEKAMADYMGSIEFKVTDKNGEEVETALEFLDQPNPQDSFDILLKMGIRDLVRYDAAAWVKSFNKAGYLTEIKPYLGTEFWKEIDRVPMAVAIPKDYITSGANMYQGWWSHGYTMRYWQRSRTGVYIPFMPEEVCYFMMYPRTDGIYGTDFLKFLKHQLQYLIDSTRAAGKTFENGIVPSIVWEHPDVMSREQLSQRIKKVEIENKGSYKFGGIIHTVNNEKVTTLAQKLHDMEWLEGQKFTAQLIWAMWGFSPTEFIGGGDNRATAYVKRNITKSRLLYPLMRHFARKINKEVLPYIKGYRDGWTFDFVRDIDLDDEQKGAQTTAIKITSYSQLVGLGTKPSVALKMTGLIEDLTLPEIEEMDMVMEQMMMGGGEEQTGEGGLPEENEQGRYGEGSESYQSINLEDYGQGAESKKPRSGEEEEKQYKKAETPIEKAVWVRDAGFAHTRKYTPGEGQREGSQYFNEHGAELHPHHVEDYLRDSTSEGSHRYFKSSPELEKAKVYINYPSEAPPGRHVGRGNRGGYYYITNVRQQHGQPQEKVQGNRAPQRKKRKKGWDTKEGKEKQGLAKIPEPPDLGGKQVKIFGKGVGVVISIKDQRLLCQSANTSETKAFIMDVLQCSHGTGNKEEVLKCAKEIGTKAGLKVSS